MYLHSDNHTWKKSIAVIYDLEYSGDLKENLGNNCSIWEMAAKSGEKEFYVLINPHLTRIDVPSPVHERYKMPTKTEFTKKNAVSFPVAIQLFKVFLKSLMVAEDQYLILMSHNGFRGDKMVLEYELARHSMQGLLIDIPIHFFDTLYFIRNSLPNQPSYSVPRLYASLFDSEIEDAHTAVSDVKALERILNYINKPYQGSIFMLFLTPFSNVNGIGTLLEQRFFCAGYTCLEHFFYVNPLDITAVNAALLKGNIIVDNIFKLNSVAFELYKYGTMRLAM